MATKNTAVAGKRFDNDTFVLHKIFFDSNDNFILFSHIKFTHLVITLGVMYALSHKTKLILDVAYSRCTCHI